MRPRILLVLLAVSLSIPLLAHPATAAYPGFNGKIVYVTDGALYMVQLDPFIVHVSGEPLVTSGSNEAPVWSPDGTKVAYVHDSTLWVVNEDGSNPHQVINHSVQGTPAWSPNGLRIAYARSGSGLWVVDADGTDPIQISTDTTAEDPAWSPVAARLAFTSLRDGNREIYFIDPDGTDEARFTNSAGADQDPNWSPDGVKLAFASERDGDFDIFSVKPDGTLLSNLSNSGGDEVDPAWSPDGLKIVYTVVTEFWTGINTMNNNGTSSGGDVIENGSNPSESQPDWQPLAEEPPPNDVFDPSSSISRPKHGVSYYQANIKTFSGNAVDFGGSGLARVEVALRRVLTDGTCLSWNGSIFVKASCTFRNWRLASGKAAWTYTLPKGLTKSVGTNVRHYVLLSRATDVAGNLEVTFEDGRNRNRFEVI